jgi:hypothetical protein
VIGEAVAPLRRALADPMAPVVALCLILVLSFAARMIDYNEPCASPCKTVASHTLIFDEAYYVNAAKVIDHINPAPGQNYHNAPLGKDPNAEHPQLAKLIIAGAIELFGDGPFAWRIGSIIFSLIALCALYALVRGAGGSGWLAAGTAGVASLDNLFLVSSRSGTPRISQSLNLKPGLIPSRLSIFRRMPESVSVPESFCASGKTTAFSSSFLKIGTTTTWNGASRGGRTNP